MNKKTIVLTAVAAAAFSAALATDAADSCVVVPETWRPVKIGAKDYFAVMRGKWIDDPSLRQANVAAFRSLFACADGSSAPSVSQEAPSLAEGIWDVKGAHRSALKGVRNAFCELNAETCSAPWAMAMWHYRGASRQFRMPFFFNMATSLNGCGTDGKPRLGHWRCETTIPEEHDTHCGITRSLGRRFYFYDYFAGANGVEVKQGDHCFYDDRTPGQLKPSEFFRDYNAIFELAARQPRGVAWTPVAALTSAYEGFLIHGYNKSVCRDAFAPNAFFYTLLTPGGTHPYRGLCDRKAGEDGCLYNSEFGEICDVICPDAGQPSAEFARVLAPYKAAFLIGGFPQPKDYDLAAVCAWTEAGGTLVCSKDALADGLVTAEMTGVAFGSDKKTSGKTLCRADGTEVDALADAYTLFVGKPTTAKPYLKDENGTVVAWENDFGKGRVITVAAYQSLPDRFVDIKDLPEEAWYDKLQGEVASGKATFPIQRHLLRRFQEDFLPVSVSGDVQWGVNRLDDGTWLVWFNNNKGVTHFQGDWSERQSDGATAFVTLLEKASGRMRKLTVSSGESRFVRLVDMPTFPVGFAETNRYAAVDLVEPFDLAVTANRPSQRKRSNRDRPEFSCSVVPCEMFTRAYVLCSVSDDPKLERAFNVRLTRWADAPEMMYHGRSRYAIADRLVDFDKAVKRPAGTFRVGTETRRLWLVEVPLDLGNIQDVVWTDTHGNYLCKIGRYLDFEVSGPLLTRVSGLEDGTIDTDPERTSAVTVYAARLERPAADFAMRTVTTGNVFHDDERPETEVTVHVNRSGRYRLSWALSSADGRVLRRDGVDVAATVTNRIDLALPENGWYAVDWRLSDGEDRTLMTHRGAFALLGKDTRLAAQGEGPYSTWESVGAHYHTPNDEFWRNAELAWKAGIRHVGRHPHFPTPMQDPVFRAKYKLAGSTLICHLENDIVPVMDGRRTEESLAEEYRKRIKEDPNCTHCQMFWESSPRPYSQAPEITGGTYDPKNELPGTSNRVAVARAACRFMRRHFPELKITVGNSLACSELIAGLIRGGVTDDMLDYMGLEHVGRGNLPERLNPESVQSADLFREMAERMGRPSWKPGLGVECNFRRDTFLGERRQAEYYVRDVLLSLCWRFPLINIGGICDAANHYACSMWGNDGLCHRWPFLYPKMAYVAYATLTKTLDVVRDPKVVPTGDDCVHAVSFVRKDGRCAAAFWTVVGKATLTVDVTGDCEWTDMLGTPLRPRRDGRSCRLEIGTSPCYLLCDKGALVSAVCVARAYDERPPADYRVVARTDDASKWRLSTGPTPDVETGLGSGVPCRVRAKAASFRTVEDEELGRCLELDLGRMDKSLPKPVMEYMTVELKDPIPLPGRPQSLGARVKGNSGWGRLYWIVEGADGRRTVSSGHRGWGSDYDEGGKMSLCFSGWRFLSYPMDEHSSITDYTINLVEDLWAEKVTYPAKLVGVAFAAESRPLFLTERREKDQKVRLSEIGIFK